MYSRAPSPSDLAEEPPLSLGKGQVAHPSLLVEGGLSELPEVPHPQTPLRISSSLLALPTSCKLEVGNQLRMARPVLTGSFANPACVVCTPQLEMQL